MLTYENGGRLVQHPSELPNLSNAKYLYLDCETSSNDPKEDSLNPWKNCRVLGIAVTADDYFGAWYIPWDLAKEWVQDTLRSCQFWVNHNIKYDMHCLALAGVTWSCGIIDTLTQAKIYDSDRLRYSLDILARDYGTDISKYEQALKPYLVRNKDYGRIPLDIIAEYACMDTITTRDLHKYLQIPKQCQQVWATEQALTPILFNIEQLGMCVDTTELKMKQLATICAMLKIEQAMHEICGIAIRPHANKDCYDLFCGQYGLPILGTTDSGAPSFDKDTLKALLIHPSARDNPKLQELLKWVLQYRKLHILNGLFIEPYLDLEVNGRIHPFYNQLVRTGRMSCKNPNAQQLSDEARALVHATPGYALVAADYSQIEFRFIAHYLKNQKVIDAYNQDPNTDFHTWVANMAGIPRDPAKNLNFAIGFGAGQHKVLQMLSGNMNLVGHLLDEAGGNRAKFEMLAEQHARHTYRQYHSLLPELRSVSKSAGKKCLERGYVFNLFGRRRHLQREFAHKAFNTVVQGSAADFLKNRAVAIHPLQYGARLLALVHDEFLFEVPIENVDPFIASIRPILEFCPISIRVPIRVSIGPPEQNWLLASQK